MSNLVEDIGETEGEGHGEPSASKCDLGFRRERLFAIFLIIIWWCELHGISMTTRPSILQLQVDLNIPVCEVECKMDEWPV